MHKFLPCVCVSQCDLGPLFIYISQGSVSTKSVTLAKLDNNERQYRVPCNHFSHWHTLERQRLAVAAGPTFHQTLWQYMVV
jgi:hypothetical protein